MKDMKRVSWRVIDQRWKAVRCRRTTGNERPCFFQIQLPVFWEESGEAGFLGEWASCIVGWGEWVLLPSVQGIIVVPGLVLFVGGRHEEWGGNVLLLKGQVLPSLTGINLEVRVKKTMLDKVCIRYW